MKIYKRYVEFRTNGLFGGTKTAIQVDADGVIRTINHKERINTAITSLEFDIEKDKERVGCLLEQGKIWNR